MAVKVLPFPNKKQSLCENYSSGLQLALCRRVGAGEVQLCTELFYCKDYLQDGIWAQLNNKKVSIYGMSYTPGVDPAIPTDTLILALKAGAGMPKATFLSAARTGATFLRQLEEVTGFNKTRFRSGKLGDDDVAIFEADIRWAHHPALLSLYSLCVRMTTAFAGGQTLQKFLAALQEGTIALSGQQTIDASRLTLLNKSGHLMLLLEKNVGLFDAEMSKNYPPNSRVDSLHNSGVISWKNKYKMEQEETK